jgi:DNA adenine methylase
LKVKKSLNGVEICCSHYFDILNKAKKGDFVYLDPPYHKENKTSFTKYQKGDFNEEEQKKLASLIKELDKRGVMFLLSNSNTEFIKELYKKFKIVEVSVGRYINNKNIKNGRDTKINNEVLIFNYSKEEEEVKEEEEEIKEEEEEIKEEEEVNTINLLKNREVID